VRREHGPRDVSAQAGPEGTAGVGERRRRQRLLVGLAGLLIALSGLSLGLASMLPYRVTEPRRVDVLVTTGFADKTLVPSGRTDVRAVRVTCLPSHFFFGTEDPACAANNRQRIGQGVLGAAIFVVGSACWVASGTERRLFSKWARTPTPGTSRRRPTYA
jgi:hypothetical protein